MPRGSCRMRCWEGWMLRTACRPWGRKRSSRRTSTTRFTHFTLTLLFLLSCLSHVPYFSSFPQDIDSFLASSLFDLQVWCKSVSQILFPSHLFFVFHINDKFWYKLKYSQVRNKMKSQFSGTKKFRPNVEKDVFSKCNSNNNEMLKGQQRGRFLNWSSVFINKWLLHSNWLINAIK